MSVMLIITIGVAVLIIAVSYIISHKSKYPQRLGTITDESERKSQYECGLETIEEDTGIETNERFFMKFYKIGIVFLIFDIESILLYPAMVIYYPTQIMTGYITTVIFIILLVLGLVYEYKKDIL